MKHMPGDLGGFRVVAIAAHVPLSAAGGANVPALQRRLMLLNGLNMLLLLSTVWAMVAKPTL